MKQFIYKIWPVLLFLAYFVWASVIAFKNSIWHDESYSYILIKNGFLDIINLTSYDVHPPLYYLVLKTWASLFSYNLYSMRVFSILLMMAAVYIFWRLVVKHFKLSYRDSLIILAVMLFGPYVVRYGQEARMYGLGALITAISLWYFQKINNNGLQSKWWKWFVLGLILALGFYTQYFLSFLAVAIGLYILYEAYKKHRSLKKTLLSSLKKLVPMTLGFGILVAPWLPVAVNQTSKVINSFWIGPITTETFINFPISYMIYEATWVLKGWHAVFAIIVLGLVIGAIFVFYKKFKTNKFAVLSLFIVVVPFLLLILISLPPLTPFFHNRYLSFYAPIFYTIVMLGILMIKSPKVRYFGLAVFVLAYIYGNFTLYSLGNGVGNAGVSQSNPHYSMNKIYQHISLTDTNVPVVAGSLGTFLDLYYYSNNNSRSVFVISPPYGFGKYGNSSVIYNRKDLQLANLSDIKNNQVWLVQSKNKDEFANIIPPSWQLSKELNIGYARASLYNIQ